MAQDNFKKAWMPRIVRAYDTTEDIILRDFLALERTTLANERTLFAYIRTSLYLILGGIALLQLEELDRLKWLGHVSYVISAFLLTFGIIRYTLLKRKLNKFYDKIKLPDASRIASKTAPPKAKAAVKEDISKESGSLQ